MPKKVEYHQNTSLITGFLVVYPTNFKLSIHFPVNYYLQFPEYLKKLFTTTLKVLKSGRNIQKSIKKRSKALAKYVVSQLLPIFQLCYRSFINSNPTL